MRGTFGPTDESALKSSLTFDFEPGTSYCNDREAHINPDIRYADITLAP